MAMMIRADTIDDDDDDDDMMIQVMAIYLAQTWSVDYTIAATSGRRIVS